MIVVVFRSRVRPDQLGGYRRLAREMEALARSMPGFISVRDFVAEDGEHVSIHEWESAAHLEAWRAHPEHLKAQGRGRRDFYEEYVLQVCETVRESRFTREKGLTPLSSPEAVPSGEEPTL